jgi:hypothetical protein
MSLYMEENFCQTRIWPRGLPRITHAAFWLDAAARRLGGAKVPA